MVYTNSIKQNTGCRICDCKEFSPNPNLTWVCTCEHIIVRHQSKVSKGIIDDRPQSVRHFPITKKKLQSSSSLFSVKYVPKEKKKEPKEKEINFDVQSYSKESTEDISEITETIEEFILDPL